MRSVGSISPVFPTNLKVSFVLLLCTLYILIHTKDPCSQSGGILVPPTELSVIWKRAREASDGSMASSSTCMRFLEGGLTEITRLDGTVFHKGGLNIYISQKCKKLSGRRQTASLSTVNSCPRSSVQWPRPCLNHDDPVAEWGLPDSRIWVVIIRIQIYSDLCILDFRFKSFDQL